MDESRLHGRQSASFVRYWDPDRGWVRTARGASRRLLTRLELDVHALVNVREQHFDGAMWQEVPAGDETLVCYAHPLRMGSQDRIFFSAARPMEEPLWSSLGNAALEWDWQDPMGERVGHPARTGLEWSLPRRQAQQLWKEMQAAGWTMTQRLPPLEDAKALSITAREIAQATTRLVEESASEPAVPALALAWRERLAVEHQRITQAVADVQGELRRLGGYWRYVTDEQAESARAALTSAGETIARVRRQLRDARRLPLRTMPDVVAELALQRAQKGLESKLDEKGLLLGSVDGRRIYLNYELRLTSESDET